VACYKHRHSGIDKTNSLQVVKAVKGETLTLREGQLQGGFTWRKSPICRKSVGEMRGDLQEGFKWREEPAAEVFKWRWAPAVGRVLLAEGDSCRESLGGRIASCRGIKVEAGPARGRV
jgi:hypothetical protein